jgi:single-strand DNA-binding protein
MSDLNRVILIGRLTRDAELKYTASGQAVGNFSIAVDRRIKSGDGWVNEANFFDVTLWGKTAESLGKYLVKGKQVAIDGELRQDRWEQDGQNRQKVVIVAQNVQLLGGGQAAGSSAASSGEPGKDSGVVSEETARRAKEARDKMKAGAADDGFDDDIPF